MNQEKTITTPEWKRQGTVLAGMLLVLAIFYYQSYASIVSIWQRSETFAHGFIILPICLWLIWRIRGNILSTEPKANYLGIPLIFGCGLVWALARYIDVLAVEQLAAVVMIPLLVFTVLGWKTTIEMIFPLFFLLFAVPLGGELTPYLINFTADFTVFMVKLVGIPVYREGTFFSLPTGDWSVVDACSGVRYLIASVTLGVLYAYLNYVSPIKRAVFVMASIIVPIIANGFRAFLIVMIGHFSDMQLATGVDHLVYGWVFFGVVIAIMFYVGSFWSDSFSESTKSKISINVGDVGKSSKAHIVTGIAVILVVFWPLKIQLEDNTFDFERVPTLLLQAPDNWKLVESPSDWRPDYIGFDREFSGRFQNENGRQFSTYIGYYARQRQGAEIGNYNNALAAEGNDKWRVIGHLPGGVVIEGVGVVPVAMMRSGGYVMMVAYSYVVAGEYVSNKYKTKLLQLKNKMLGEVDDGAAIFVSVGFEKGNEEEAAQQLADYFSLVRPNVSDALTGMREVK